MRILLSRIAFWGACLAVLIGTLLPSSHLPHMAISLWDKAEHAAAFALLYGLGHALYAQQRLKLALGLLLFGAAIELAQASVGWRSGDWLDWLADAVGIGLGLLIACTWTQARQKLRLREAS
jgi:hypothetical protein